MKLSRVSIIMLLLCVMGVVTSTTTTTLMSTDAQCMHGSSSALSTATEEWYPKYAAELASINEQIASEISEEGTVENSVLDDVQGELIYMYIRENRNTDLLAIEPKSLHLLYWILHGIKANGQGVLYWITGSPHQEFVFNYDLSQNRLVTIRDAHRFLSGNGGSINFDFILVRWPLSSLEAVALRYFVEKAKNALVLGLLEDQISEEEQDTTAAMRQALASEWRANSNMVIQQPYLGCQLQHRPWAKRPSFKDSILRPQPSILGIGKIFLAANDMPLANNAATSRSIIRFSAEGTPLSVILSFALISALTNELQIRYQPPFFLAPHVQPSEVGIYFQICDFFDCGVLDQREGIQMVWEPWVHDATDPLLHNFETTSPVTIQKAKEMLSQVVMEEKVIYFDNVIRRICIFSNESCCDYSQDFSGCEIAPSIQTAMMSFFSPLMIRTGWKSGDVHTVIEMNGGTGCEISAQELLMELTAKNPDFSVDGDLVVIERFQAADIDVQTLAAQIPDVRMSRKVIYNRFDYIFAMMAAIDAEIFVGLKCSLFSFVVSRVRTLEQTTALVGSGQIPPLI